MTGPQRHQKPSLQPLPSAHLGFKNACGPVPHLVLISAGQTSVGKRGIQEAEGVLALSMEEWSRGQ